MTPHAWTPFATPSNANWNALLGGANRKAALLALSGSEVHRLTASWLGKAHKAQLPPETDDWRTWLFLGGRGAGKTRAGAQWLGARAMAGQRLALVGPTLHDVREVMVEGPSGLIATADPDNRPTYEVSRRRLRYPSGAVAFAFSAEDPDSLRGPQFHHAWADEFCAWPQAGTVLAQLRLGLRLGPRPQLVITSTPKPARALRLLMAEPDLTVSRAPTEENANNLSPAFLHGLQRLYGGTRLAAQELDGIVVEADGQALWRAGDFPPLRSPPPDRLDRIVLAVDPTASAGGDACGLVVAGRLGDRAHVLADRTVRGLSPLGWAKRAAETAEAFGVDLVVAEANQGGEMVSTLLRLADCPAPVKLVRASVSKRLRAEPVAALYEQGRVRHAPGLGALEEELMALGAADSDGAPTRDRSGADSSSPDRADALVWALTELLLEHGPGPRVARL
jgi:phage terminase large subunit-like protein